jgi:glutaredoxin
MTKRAQVRLYTRPNCHLCEEARREMLSAGCADEFFLEEINIDDDPGLKQAYGQHIPVITINGREAFRHRLTAAAFRELIRQADKR